MRERDKKERLTKEDFQSFVGGEKATEIPAKFEMLANNPTEVVDINNFAELRDYLLLLVLSKWSTLWGCRQPHSGGVRAGC